MSQPAIGDLCWKCKHIRADYTCAAFPEGIPSDIWQGVNHTEPFPGDHGLQFEPRGKEDPVPDFISLTPQRLSE